MVSSTSTSTSPGLSDRSSGVRVRQPGQEPGGDRVELPDVTEA